MLNDVAMLLLCGLILGFGLVCSSVLLILLLFCYSNILHPTMRCIQLDPFFIHREKNYAEKSNNNDDNLWWQRISSTVATHSTHVPHDYIPVATDEDEICCHLCFIIKSWKCRQLAKQLQFMSVSWIVSVQWSHPPRQTKCHPVTHS